MKPWHWALIMAICLSATQAGCNAANPGIIAELQNQAQTQDPATPTRLTDLGILRYGERILAAWGLRSSKTAVWNTTGQIALAALSTGALAASGGTASPDVTLGLVGGGNFLLQLFNIFAPAERNDARQEGAAMILDARGAFLEGLAAKGVYQISNRRFTPQGAIYFRNIGAAIKVVDKLLVGLAPRVEDLQAVKPVPIHEQPDPGHEASIP